MNATLVRLTRLSADFARTADGQLLDAFLAGSQAAFRELVVRHGPLVFAVCDRVLRHRQDSEDAFQAVFLVLARRAADVWPREVVGSWLYGVAHRVALKARTARARRRNREHPLEDVAQPPSPVPEPDLAEVIDRAVRRLPEAYRAAVVACDLEGLSRAEAAERLGWKEGTLSGRLARARQLLAQRLRKSGLELPAGLAGVLGTDAAVRAGLTDAAVEVCSGHAVAGVPAPVAALTEGVVHGMFLAKLKTAAAVLLVAGMMGVGVWASAGAGGSESGGGDGPGSGGPPTVGGQGGGAQPAKRHPDLEAMQGQWWILARGEGDQFETFDPNAAHDPRQFAVSVRGDSFYPPYPGPIQKLAFLDRQMTIALDPAKKPKQFDLVHDAGRLTGIYEFSATETNDSLILLRLVIATEGGRPTAFEPRGVGAVEVVLGRYADPKKDPSSNAGLGPKERPVDLTTAEERLQIAHLELEQALKAIKDRRPAKDLDGFAVQLAQDKARIDATLQLLVQAEAEVTKARLRVKPAPKLPAPNAPGAAGNLIDDAKTRREIERQQVERQLAAAELEQAKAEADMAKLHAEEANANAALAQAGSERAQKKLTDAHARLTLAEKRLEDLRGMPRPGVAPAPKPGDPAFTIYVRTRTAPEKVIPVKATGKETVLDALAYTATDVGPNPELTVWVVRDKAIMPVDYPTVTKPTGSKTNYELKSGDQVFVQVKVGN